jgi:hypothetical protein
MNKNESRVREAFSENEKMAGKMVRERMRYLTFADKVAQKSDVMLTLR